MTSDFRYEIKETSLPVIWLETLTEKSGSVRLNEHEQNLVPPWEVRQILVDPVDDEDWRDRPRTDPSSISDSELA